MKISCSTFRTKEKLRSGELTVSGDQWPTLLYGGYTYDPEHPWDGLFRGTILILVGRIWFRVCRALTSAPGI